MLSLRFPISVEKVPLNVNRSPCPSSKAQNLSCSSCSRSAWQRAFAGATGLAAREEDKEVNGRMALTGDLVKLEEPLPSGLRWELMPRHVAVIMDGSARWARRRGLPASSGHEAGVRSLKELVELCGKWGIRILTVFAFSSENWSRPKAEVEFLMGLFERVIEFELQNFSREGVRISTIGDSSRLPKSLQKLLNKAECSTKDNSRLHLVVAVSYSGKSDIAQACKSIAHRVRDGLIQLEDVDEELIEEELATSCCEFPCPDLLIRTSGELRLSNFLLWQLAYAELFFSEALWPDFGKAEFVEALRSFQQRLRRYGSRES
ncbi:dehydrodolichyl diphosphate synthase 2-like [Punica granatum]|uniref:Alkyl transferase n=1 Tax=Punica granatum TaxID=22663 RepID=A0A6P8E9H3_PUNGR|nr:dehydrodolichyl diphosphate synthase 2-like [Punica granatum]